MVSTSGLDRTCQRLVGMSEEHEMSPLTDSTLGHDEVRGKMVKKLKSNLFQSAGRKNQFFLFENDYLAVLGGIILTSSNIA